MVVGNQLSDPFAAEAQRLEANTPAQDDPFAAAAAQLESEPATSPGVQGAKSYREIAAYEDANRVQNIEKLKALAARPDITPTQRTRIEGMIKKLDDPMFYNRVTEKRMIGSNFFRGVTRGVVGDVALGTADLATAITSLPAKAVDIVAGTNLSKPFDAFRERIAESQEILKQTTDAQGVEGALGRVAGAVGGGLVGGAGSEAKVVGGGIYGAASNIVVKRLSSLEGGIGNLARLGAKGNWLQRAAINVISGLPIDLVQAATLPETEAVKAAHEKQNRGENLTAEEESALDDHLSTQLKVLALGTGGNAVGGLVLEGAASKLASTVQKINAGRQLSQAELGGQADAMIAIANVAEQAKNAKRAASQAWNRGDREVRRHMVNGLEAETYDMAYKDLPSEVKHAAQLRFGGPDIDMGLVTQARRATDSKLNKLVQEAVGFKGRSPEEIEFVLTKSFPDMTPENAQAMAKGLADGNDEVRLAWAMKANDALQPRAPMSPQSTPTETPGAPIPPEAGTGEGLLPEGITGEGATRIKSKLGVKLDEELATLNTKLAQAEERAAHAERRAHVNERAALVDPLTGVGSRHAWEQARTSIEADPNTTVIMIDIANFKGVNDHLGHEAGDEALREIGEILNKHVDKQGRIFRYGGDEFIVAVPKEKAAIIAQQLREAYGQRPIGDTGFTSHFRIGIGNTVKEADGGLKAAQQAEAKAGFARNRPIGGGESPVSRETGPEVEPRILTRRNPETGDIEHVDVNKLPFEERPSIADEVALSEQSLDSFAQMKAREYSRGNSNEFYQQALNNDPALAKILSPDDYKELQRLHEDVKQKTKLAENAGEENVRGTGLMTNAPKAVTDEMNLELDVARSARSSFDAGQELPSLLGSHAAPEDPREALRAKLGLKTRDEVALMTNDELNDYIAHVRVTEKAMDKHILGDKHDAYLTANEVATNPYNLYSDQDVANATKAMDDIEAGLSPAQRALFFGRHEDPIYVTAEEARNIQQNRPANYNPKQIKGNSIGTNAEQPKPKETKLPGTVREGTDGWDDAIRIIEEEGPNRELDDGEVFNIGGRRFMIMSGAGRSVVEVDKRGLELIPLPSGKAVALFDAQEMKKIYHTLSPEDQAAVRRLAPTQVANILRTPEEISADMAKVRADVAAGRMSQEAGHVELAYLKSVHEETVAQLETAARVSATIRKAINQRSSTLGKDLGKFSPQELADTKQAIREHLADADRQSPEAQTLSAEFKRIMDFESKRDGGQGVTLYMHPSIGGGLVGFMAGFALPADDDDERFRNGVLFGAIGLGGGVYAARRWGPAARRVKPNLPPWEENISKKVVSGMDLRKPPVPFMMRLRKLYNFVARRSGAIEAATEALGGKNLPVQRNPGKLAAIFGRWQAQTESFLLDQPSLVDKAGNIRWLNSSPAQKIIDLVKGDTDRLGYLMAAARTLELAQEGKKTGISLLDARMTFQKAPMEYHQAMLEMRKFNAALVDVADDASLVIDRSKMSDVFYAPLNRIFGGAPGSAPVKQTITSKVKSSLGVPNPIKFQRGGQQLILNPAEATISNVPRILRSAELNKTGVALADLLDAADPAIAKQIGQRLHGSDLKQVHGYAVKIQQLQSEMEALGSSITTEEAEKIILTFSNEALSIQDDILRIWRNGRIEQWRLNEEVAKSFRSLNPDELHGLVKFLGMPTMLARTGITNNPMFVLRQAWRDNWQAWLNTQYGFIPGVDQARGWFHIITRSKAYREYLAAGGGFGALAEQRFARGITALPDVKRAPTANELTKAMQEIKELHPLRAYQTLITPVIEAARVGEYLRARGAGASTLEAVFAAKHVTGNFQQIGSGMRAANHLTLFLNPAIQSLDASARSFARNPVKYLTKAFVGIALPSLYFWHRYQSDHELDELRRTETGRRYWFARSPDGSIVKIPKPIFDGQVFGSSVESALDMSKLNDKASVDLTTKSIENDIAVNLLPQIGAIPVSLWANKDLGTGAPIIPPALTEVDPKYQVNPNTSLAARVIGEKTRTAPAQVDYAIRSTFGSLGNNVVRMVSNAVEYQQHGYVPPKEELPFLDELFARYPSLNVGSIREFYRQAEQVHIAANTLGHAAKYDPLNVNSYVLSNVDKVALIDMYQKTREDLAELRASINFIRSAPVEQIPPKDKQIYIDAMLRAMITEAKQTNDAAAAVRRHLNPKDIQK